MSLCGLTGNQLKASLFSQRLQWSVPLAGAQGQLTAGPVACWLLPAAALLLLLMLSSFKQCRREMLVFHRAAARSLCDTSHDPWRAANTGRPCACRRALLAGAGGGAAAPARLAAEGRRRRLGRVRSPRLAQPGRDVRNFSGGGRAARDSAARRRRIRATQVFRQRRSPRCPPVASLRERKGFCIISSFTTT